MAHPARLRTTAPATALLLLVAPFSPLRAQADTAVDLAGLRAAVRAYPDSFPLVLALGQTLTRTATEREKDWPQRAEARKALDRALRLRPNDPRPYLEIGALLRKQGQRVDAMRVLRRAEERAEAPGAQLSAADRAEMHLQMALTYEVWWEDGEHMGILPADFTRGSCAQIAQLYSASGPGPPSSARANLIAYDFICPAVYDELMANWQPLDLHETDYAAMVHHFREALRSDATATTAGFRLLRHLAAADAWAEYLEVAEQLARRVPADATALLFLGLGYHQTGRPDRADSAFTVAMERAAPDMLQDLLKPAQLLERQDSIAFAAFSEPNRSELADIFWRARDPLFLTAHNERLAEHLARLAYVEVAYSTPQSGIRGRFTDRGAAWLKYGRPRQIRAIRPGDAILEFWDYGEGPDLVFMRQRTYRYSRHEEMSAEYMRYVHERVPELFAPEHPRIVAQIPFQAAAFRASDGRRGAVLEVYAALPGGVLRSESDAPEIETGVFVVTGSAWEPSAALRGRQGLFDSDTLLDAAFPLPAGRYVVSLEAAAGDVAAQYRQRVEVPKFDSSLALSDLLLVERFGTEEPLVDDRMALAPVVSRTSLFPAGTPIGVLWEIYGLQTDSAGIARYTVTAEIADTAFRNTVAEPLRGAATGGPDGKRMAWDGTRAPRADGAVVEYVSIRLPNVKPGSYRIFVTVTDQATGRSLTVHRPFAVTKP
jgi:GWxTD domain-containing protein